MSFGNFGHVKTWFQALNMIDLHKILDVTICSISVHITSFLSTGEFWEWKSYSVLLKFVSGWATYNCNNFYNEDEIWLQFLLQRWPNMIATCKLGEKGANMTVMMISMRGEYNCNLSYKSDCKWLQSFPIGTKYECNHRKFSPLNMHWNALLQCFCIFSKWSVTVKFLSSSVDWFYRSPSLVQ